LTALALVPVGAWAATVWTTAQQPVRGPLVAGLIGLIFAVCVEAAQFVLRSGVCDATRLVFAVAGVGVGAIGIRLAGRSWFR